VVAVIPCPSSLANVSGSHERTKAHVTVATSGRWRLAQSRGPTLLSQKSNNRFIHPYSSHPTSWPTLANASPTIDIHHHCFAFPSLAAPGPLSSSEHDRVHGKFAIRANGRRGAVVGYESPHNWQLWLNGQPRSLAKSTRILAKKILQNQRCCVQRTGMHGMVGEALLIAIYLLRKTTSIYPCDLPSCLRLSRPAGACPTEQVATLRS
jgi:hypothetical protein